MLCPQLKLRLHTLRLNPLPIQRPDQHDFEPRKPRLRLLPQTRPAVPTEEGGHFELLHMVFGREGFECRVGFDFEVRGGDEAGG